MAIRNARGPCSATFGTPTICIATTLNKATFRRRLVAYLLIAIWDNGRAGRESAHASENVRSDSFEILFPSSTPRSFGLSPPPARGAQVSSSLYVSWREDDWKNRSRNESSIRFFSILELYGDFDSFVRWNRWKARLECKDCSNSQSWTKFFWIRNKSWRNSIDMRKIIKKKKKNVKKY